MSPSRTHYAFIRRRHRSMGCPTAVYWQGRSGDRGRCFACEKHGKSTKLFNRRKTLVRLLRKQNITDDLLTRDFVRFRLALNLTLDQGRVDIAGADRVTGDVRLCSFQSDDFGEADDPVLCRDISRLERGRDEPVRRSDIDDATEF